MPERRTSSTLSGGVKPRLTKSSGMASRSSALTCAMNSISEYCRSDGTGSVIPQSSTHNRPSSVRSRLPGCGSQCSTPVSSSIVRYALIATAQRRGTSGEASRSSRVPCTHSVVSTRRVLSSRTTSGAVTAASCLDSIARRNVSVLAASCT